MFRQAIVRALRPAARPMVRPVVRAATPMVRPMAIRSVRLYSTSPSGLERAEVEKRILEVFKAFDKVGDSSKLTPTANFVTDLGLDSLDIVEVIVAVEEEFGIEIPDKESDEIKSIDNAIEYIMAQSEAH
uniref:Acyl carrier protein n=1 Tax=Blastobotrys adeninivorans TaxID=409370 RepID=A0A060TC32_BLAAD